MKKVFCMNQHWICFGCKRLKKHVIMKRNPEQGRITKQKLFTIEIGCSKSRINFIFFRSELRKQCP